MFFFHNQTSTYHHLIILSCCRIIILPRYWIILSSYHLIVSSYSRMIGKEKEKKDEQEKREAKRNKDEQRKQKRRAGKIYLQLCFSTCSALPVPCSDRFLFEAPGHTHMHTHRVLSKFWVPSLSWGVLRRLGVSWSPLTLPAAS